MQKLEQIGLTAEKIGLTVLAIVLLLTIIFV
jgi:hypothetical protein